MSNWFIDINLKTKVVQRVCQNFEVVRYTYNKTNNFSFFRISHHNFSIISSQNQIFRPKYQIHQQNAKQNNVLNKISSVGK